MADEAGLSTWATGAMSALAGVDVGREPAEPLHQATVGIAIQLTRHTKPVKR